MRVAGFVLVGGRSSRMGSDKARLQVKSHLLVEDVAQKVKSIAGNVALTGASHRYRDLPLDAIDDLRHPVGPLGGIETALASGRGDLNLIVACDMPGLRVEWLASLLAAATETDSKCVVCQEASGNVHPLCGVWHSSCLPAVRNALDSGRLRVFDLLEELEPIFVPIESPLHNVNTPQEWSRWKASRMQEAVQS